MYIKSLIFSIIIGSILFFMFGYPIFFGIENRYENELEKDYYTGTPKFFADQLSFRELVMSKYEENLHAWRKINSVDSSHNDQTKNKLEIKYLLPDLKKTYVANLNNHTVSIYILTGYDSITYEYSIDDKKINAILNSQNISANEFVNVLKYQDYINSNSKFHFHIRKTGLTIYIGFLIFLYFLLVFLFSIRNKMKDDVISEKYIVRLLNRIKAFFDTEKISKEQKEKDLKELTQNYTDRLKEIGNELEMIKNGNEDIYIIEDIARKSELKMKEVGNRSNLMLVSGLVMAFIGLVIFYLTLPANLGNNNSIGTTLSLIIRPALILLFIESISWYLLKQHKNLLKDYKFFYSIYIKKLNYLAAYKLIKKSTNTQLEGLLPAILLTEEIKSASENNDSVDQTENPVLLLNSFIEKLINKV